MDIIQGSLETWITYLCTLQSRIVKQIIILENEQHITGILKSQIDKSEKRSTQYYNILK